MEVLGVLGLAGVQGGRGRGVPLAGRAALFLRAPHRGCKERKFGQPTRSHAINIMQNDIKVEKRQKKPFRSGDRHSQLAAKCQHRNIHDSTILARKTINSESATIRREVTVNVAEGQVGEGEGRRRG